jgi:hypothetical protein
VPITGKRRRTSFTRCRNTTGVARSANAPAPSATNLRRERRSEESLFVIVGLFFLIGLVSYSIRYASMPAVSSLRVQLPAAHPQSDGHPDDPRGNRPKSTNSPAQAAIATSSIIMS